MSHDIFASEFQGIKVIIPQNMLNRYEKKVLLLDIINTWKELVIALKKTLIIVYIIIEDLIFYLV